MDGWMDRWVERQTDMDRLRQTDRWTDGWMDGQILVSWAQNKSDYKTLYHVQKTPRNIHYSCTTLSKYTKHFA